MSDARLSTAAVLNGPQSCSALESSDAIYLLVFMDSSPPIPKLILERSGIFILERFGTYVKKKRALVSLTALAVITVSLDPCFAYSFYKSMQSKQQKSKRKKNPNAVALGRLGGLKGGKARIAQLTPEERRELARKAVRARWAKQRERKNSQSE
jgi:hypothetical protein